jgi:hypothetical protein
MAAVLGCVLFCLWIGAGILGEFIRGQKGYEGSSAFAVWWGGPFHLLASLLLPRR